MDRDMRFGEGKREARRRSAASPGGQLRSIITAEIRVGDAARQIAESSSARLPPQER